MRSRERSYTQIERTQASPNGRQRCSKAAGAGSVSSASNPVTAPQHYAGAYGVEAKEALRNMADRPLAQAKVPMPPSAVFWWCAAMKYLWRFPFKNGLQDVAKCHECLRLMEEDVRRHQGAR